MDMFWHLKKMPDYSGKRRIAPKSSRNDAMAKRVVFFVAALRRGVSSIDWLGLTPI
jgi:hypothetical protein